MHTPVTVLGLGAMGTALARAYLAVGHPVTVWNRTSGRAAELDQLDVVRAETVAAAVAASPLVIVCLLDYSTVHAALDADADALSGKVLINLTNGTPAQARATADWAAQHGAEYLDGGIMAVPPMIGGPTAFVLYSGSASAFGDYQNDLAKLGRAAYVGADPGLAALQDLALLSGMYGMFSGAFQALALVGSEKIPATDFTTELLVPWLTAMLASLPRIAADLQYGPQPGPAGSNLAMQAAGFGNLVEAALDQRVDASLLKPMQALLTRAVEAGHGDKDLAAVVPLLTDSWCPESGVGA
jgi:3-hydroxyisobutyrate dehydrogenase-like beta-hydroxyacid dehydrogenase